MMSGTIGTSSPRPIGWCSWRLLEGALVTVETILHHAQEGLPVEASKGSVGQ